MIISRKENVAVLKDDFSKIFSYRNPFGKMFATSILDKVLLCPINGYCLSRKQLSALILTAQMLGESSYYLSEIEGNKAFEKNDDSSAYDFGHWELGISTSYDEYEKLRIPIENALYSKNGKWGVIISHEDFAVLGGTSEFVTLFKKNYPEWQQDTKNFIEMWNSNKEHYGSDISWIPDFLKYINE